jgi:hypothetical protein
MSSGLIGIFTESPNAGQQKAEIAEHAGRTDCCVPVLYNLKPNDAKSLPLLLIIDLSPHGDSASHFSISAGRHPFFRAETSFVSSKSFGHEMTIKALERHPSNCERPRGIEELSSAGHGNL